MIGYLLDTKAVVRFAAEETGVVGRRIAVPGRPAIGLSSFVVHQFFYGIYRSARVAANLKTLQRTVAGVPISDFTFEDAQAAGEVRAALADLGTPIGPFDVLIAGQARARGLTLVTKNMRESRRVAGLQAEDWSVG